MSEARGEQVQSVGKKSVRFVTSFLAPEARAFVASCSREAAAVSSAMGDNLASSSEDEKSRVGRKGPRRSDDNPETAEALRDDMTIAGSVVGQQKLNQQQLRQSHQQTRQNR